MNVAPFPWCYNWDRVWASLSRAMFRAPYGANNVLQGLAQCHHPQIHYTNDFHCCDFHHHIHLIALRHL